MSRRGVGGMDVTISVSAKDDLRAFTRGVKKGSVAAVSHWNKHIAKRHFVRGAGRRYGHKRRSVKYNKRKLRQKGHETDLVYSGETREMVSTRFRRPTVRKVNGEIKAAARLLVPRHFFKKHPGGPDKVDEFLTTTDKEAGEMAEVMMKDVDRAMNPSTIRRGRTKL